MAPPKILHRDFHSTTDELLSILEGLSPPIYIGIRPAGAADFTVRDTQELADYLQTAKGTYVLLAVGDRPFPRDGSHLNIDREKSVQIVLGLLREGRLFESSITAYRDAGPGVWKLGQAMARALKRIGKAGVTGVNPAYGATAEYHDHRVTEGALQAHRKGVKLVTSTGAVELTPWGEEGSGRG